MSVTSIASKKAPQGISPAEWQARVDLAALYRLIAYYDMTDLIYTHITLRVPGADDEFLINPFGSMFEEITASSLVRIDNQGQVLWPQGAKVNPAGYIVHSAIHQKSTGAHCVVHTHSRAGMAVAAMKQGLLPLNQRSLPFYNRLSYHDYEGIALDEGERERLYQDLGSNKAMVLRNHGLLTVGEDCAEAFSTMYFLETACRMQVDTLSMVSSLDDIVLPSKEVCERTVEQFDTFPGSARTREWPNLLRLLDREMPGYDT